MPDYTRICNHAICSVLTWLGGLPLGSAVPGGGGHVRERDAIAEEAEPGAALRGRRGLRVRLGTPPMLCFGAIFVGQL